MAMIKCPECGKEISDHAKVCPECGFAIKKKRGKVILIVAIAIIVLVIVSTAIVFIYRNKEKQEKITSINEVIQEIGKGNLPSQDAYNQIISDYNSLSDTDKTEIGNWKVVSNLKGIDLEKVNKISEKINKISDSSPFNEIVELKEEVDLLDSNVQQYIDSSKLENLMKLTDIEEAALAACKNIKSVMKNQDSFEVQKVTVKNDLDKKNFYWVLVEYSGTNSFGGTLDKTSCFGITSDFEDPFFGLAQITGYTDYLDSTTSYNEYTKCTKKEEIVDPDKITYYLNN
ncbi:zinc ribbon domain-containing protein [Jutongia hominis]|uniref:Zinc ribbon domain-containing protein n=1 Tax=Jutongia hominis TaxID=2763664 RepID=A0ABR7MYC0_9FIRM|nr:zinc ribbon domain-containing protein [Jutongia hominis]MBC8558188.1 zinc ribbon domain-containing protein [Jutongia hominis]